MSRRCARCESCWNWPLTFLLGASGLTSRRFGGRNRSRTCDLFLVMEALVPTELCALRGSLADSIYIRRPTRRPAGPPSLCAERTAGTPFPHLDPQRSLGNDRTYLPDRMAQQIEVFGLQQADEV